MNDTANAAAQHAPAPAKPAPEPKPSTFGTIVSDVENAAAVGLSTLTNALSHGTSLTTSVTNSTADLLMSLKGSAEPEIIKIVEAAVPWWAKTFVTSTEIDNGLNYAISMMEGAAKGIMPTVETTQKLVAEATAYIDRHTPSFAKPLIGPIEDAVVVGLQKLGMIPASWHRGLMPAAKKAA